jgi:type III secretion protein L
MVGPYRLNSFGFVLAAGAHIVPREQFTAIENADGLLAQAEAASEDLRHQAAEAYQDERRRGYDDGLAEGRLEAMDRLLRENAALDMALREVERDLARIVADCTRKLVVGFDDTRRTEAVVHAALIQMRRERRAELRVPSGFYSHFRARIADILIEFPEVELVDIVEDSSLKPGQITFETSIGRVDGNVHTSLSDLEELMRSARAKTTADVLDGLDFLPQEAEA